MNARRLSVFAAVAVLSLAVAGTGCGNKCKNETPKICGVPSCSNMAAGQTVTVNLQVAPSCNQAAPQCVVVLDNLAATGTIQFDPQSEACDSSSSCGLPTCALDRVACQFTAPSTPGTYNLVAFDSAGTSFPGTLQVAAGGTNTSCSL